MDALNVHCKIAKARWWRTMFVQLIIHFNAVCCLFLSLFCFVFLLSFASALSTQWCADRNISIKSSNWNEQMSNSSNFWIITPFMIMWGNVFYFCSKWSKCCFKAKYNEHQQWQSSIRLKQIISNSICNIFVP